MTKIRKILLLGGTTEAVELNETLAGRPEVDLITSLAGRTRTPTLLSGKTVVGGFGGEEGLINFIVDNQIELVIDTSHPFAGKITQNACAACAECGIAYLRFQRPEWEKVSGDRWISVGSIKAAAKKACDFNRIFLTVGRQELSPFEGISGKFFLVRSIEKAEFMPQQSEVRFIRTRGPFSKEDEVRLLREYQIDLVISKNSGGLATYPKIAAARELNIPVAMIKRPVLPDCSSFSDMGALLNAIGL